MGRVGAIAQPSGASRMSIVVEDANAGALKLNMRCDSVEQARRPYVPLPGSRDTGHWLMLEKTIAIQARVEPARNPIVLGGLAP